MKRLMFGLLAVLVAAPALAQSAPSGQRTDDAAAYRAAYQFVARERWEDALNAMRAFAQAYPQSRHVDEASFWACLSLERLPARRAEAATCYDEFSRRYPQSTWRDDAEARRLQLAVQATGAAPGGAARGGSRAPTSPSSSIVVSNGTLYEREAAAEALRERYGAVTVSGSNLYRATSAESSVEVLAIQALARPGNEQAIDDLRRLALEHPSLAVREAAIGGLGRIGTTRANETLVELIGGLLERAANRDSVSAYVAVNALQQAARPGSNVLLPFVERYYRDARLPRDVRWTLLMTQRVAATAEAQALLWRVAQDREMPARQRSEALQWLAPYFEDEDVTRVGTMLSSEPDAAVRETLVQALTHLLGAMPLRSSTTWRSGVVHYTEADGIVRVVSPGSTEALLARAQGQEDRARTLAEATEEVRDRQARRERLATQALQVLVALLRTEPEPRVQRAIVRALGAAGYDVGVEALLGVALDAGAEESVRQEALQGLGQIGTEDAYAALRSSLERLDAPRLLTMAMRALTSSTAYRVRSDAIPDFVRLTGHADPSVRRAAVDALGRLDAPQARQALLDLIRNAGR